MALGIYTAVAFAPQGGLAIVVPGATVEVRREDTLALASIFSDRAGTLPLASLICDANGRFQFYAAPLPQGYKITVTFSSPTTSYNHILRNQQVVIDSTLVYAPDGTPRFEIASSGLLASVDNAYDIGLSGSNRIRNLFATGTLVAAGMSLLTATIGDPTTDISTKLLVRGITKGLRIGTNAGSASLEAVDQTGSASYQPLTIGGASMTFSISGGGKWFINSAGHLGASTDNINDIGATGASRPRTGYFGTSTIVGNADLLRGKGEAAGLGGTISVTNGAATDYEPLALVGEIVDVFGRTGVNTSARAFRAQAAAGATSWLTVTAGVAGSTLFADSSGADASFLQQVKGAGTFQWTDTTGTKDRARLALGTAGNGVNFEVFNGAVTDYGPMTLRATNVQIFARTGVLTSAAALFVSATATADSFLSVAASVGATYLQAAGPTNANIVAQPKGSGKFMIISQDATRDRLDFQPEAAGSGVTVLGVNNGSTDYTPISFRGSFVDLGARTGVLTYALALRATALAAADSYVQVIGGVANSYVGAAGSPADVALLLRSKGLGAVRLTNANSVALFVATPNGLASPTNSFQAECAGPGNVPWLRSVGETNSGIGVAASGTGSVYLGAQGGVSAFTVIGQASVTAPILAYGGLAAQAAMMVLPHGTTPAAPANGSVWTTTAGIFVRINGATVGPLAAAGGGTPVGMIAWFHAVPAGWLQLNGQTVSKATYPALWTHGSGFLTANQTTSPGLYLDVDASNFKVPNLSAMFLRGTGSADANHNAGALGTRQDDTNLAHTHTASDGGGFQVTTGGPSYGSSVAGSTSTPTTSSSGAAEGKPINVSLIPCVKAV